MELMGIVIQCVTTAVVAWMTVKVAKLGHGIEAQAVEAQKGQLGIAQAMAEIQAQQLRASLFDRRLVIYEAISKMVEYAGQPDGPSDDELRATWMAANSCKYWFGEAAGSHAQKMAAELQELSRIRRGLRANLVPTQIVLERAQALMYWLQLPRREELDRLVLPLLMIEGRHAFNAPAGV